MYRWRRETFNDLTRVDISWRLFGTRISTNYRNLHFVRHVSRCNFRVALRQVGVCTEYSIAYQSEIQNQSQTGAWVAGMAFLFFVAGFASALSFKVVFSRIAKLRKMFANFQHSSLLQYFKSTAALLIYEVLLSQSNQSTPSANKKSIHKVAHDSMP